MKEKNKKNIEFILSIIIPVLIIASGILCFDLISAPFEKVITLFGIESQKSDKTENAQNIIDTLYNTTKSAITVGNIDSDENLYTDIDKLVEAAKVSQKNDKNDGKIIEKTYGKEAANIVYDNVLIKNVTNSHTVNVKECLNAKAALSIDDKSKPLVLIYHTHTTESFELLDRGYYSNSNPTRSKDPSQNMVRVGKAIVLSLEKAGFNCIHDTEIHDLSYNGSYAHSRAKIEVYKKKYPTLQVIIDVHRDGIKLDSGAKIKPVTTIDGKKAAQIMIIAGCRDGRVKVFDNWEDNLNFAVQLQKRAEDLYPTLMRPIYFSPRKYNMDTSKCGILLEMGSDSNTLSEAAYSGTLIGNALAALLNDYVV